VDSPNGNILQYQLTRKLLSGSTGGSANTDSILTVTPSNYDDTVFFDTVRYLPPGATYRIYVQAMDSTGHLSQIDSLDISDSANRFSNSTATCPSGYTPIPAATFQLGDTDGQGDPDELPAKHYFIKSFCIENYEHRDNTGAFQIHMTWQQANAACESASPADSTHLCTEAEWERACKGPDPAPPLTYGYQAEDSTNPGAMLNVCNIGTGDSIMAVTQSLRNPSCLTKEGAFDMPGNLAEWTQDAYSVNAYSLAEAGSDTLYPGRPLVAPNDTGLHGFRGGYYLDTHLPTATTLHSARCSNRDYPTQIRPQVYPGCINPSQPLVALIYGNSLLPPRCLPIPDSLQGRSIDSVSPGADSNQIIFLIHGVAQPVIYTLPPNPSYDSSRPISAEFTPLALAAITL